MFVHRYDYFFLCRLINEILASPMFNNYLAFFNSVDGSSLDALLGHVAHSMETFLDKNSKKAGTYHWEVKFMLCYILEAFHHIRPSHFALAIESLIPVFARLPRLFLETMEDFGAAFLKDMLSDSKGIIFLCSILAKLIDQGLSTKPIITSLESNTRYIPLILSESWRMVETGTVSAEDFSILMFTFMSSKDKGIQDCSAGFLRQLVDSSNAELFFDEYLAVVDKLSALLRNNKELFILSNLGRFAHTSAEIVLRREDASGINKLIKAFYPVDTNVFHRRYWSPFRPGTQIWWYDAKSYTWNPGMILSVDNSLSPPSYTVKTDGGVRDTEPERLSLRHSGPFQVPHPGDSVHVDHTMRNYAIQEEELVQLKVVFSLLVDQFGEHHCDKITLEELGRTLSSIASIFSFTWEELGRDDKVATMHQCSIALKVACTNLEEFVTTSLISSLNKIVKNMVGQELEDLSSICNFLDKLHSNQALQRSEKVKLLFFVKSQSFLCYTVAIETNCCHFIAGYGILQTTSIYIVF